MLNNCTVKVDPFTDALTYDVAESASITEDIDSALGFGDCIPFSAMGSLYMLPNFKDTLTESVHWTHTVLVQTEIEQVSNHFFGRRSNNNYLNSALQEYHAIQVQYHKIPNVGYIKIASRHIGRIMLPALYSKDGNAKDLAVSVEILKDIFDIMHHHCVQLNAMEEGHMPPSYNAEMFRQTFHGTQPGNSSVLIRAGDMAEFTRRVLVDIRREPWGRGAFWFNQFRGFRAATSKAAVEGQFGPASVTDAFDRMGLDYYEDLIEPKNWMLDLGWEVQCHSEALLWRRDAFAQIVAQWLQVPDADANAMVQSAAFNFDSAAQLHDAGGFRYELSRMDAVQSGIVYMQCYSTEKHLIHKVGERRSALNISFADVVKDGAQDYCTKLTNALADAADSSANARAEVRVLGDRLVQVACRVPFSQVQLTRLMINFPANVWFHFKALRLHGMGMLLKHWYTGDIECRVLHDALQLVLALIWSINALNNRPEDFAAERALANAVCPAVLRNGEWIPQLNLYGIHFIAGIQFHPLRNGGVGFTNFGTLPPETLQKLMGSQFSIANIRRVLEGKRRSVAGGQQAGSSTQHLIKRRRITNKGTAHDAVIPAGLNNPFKLEEQGFALPSTVGQSADSSDDSDDENDTNRRNRRMQSPPSLDQSAWQLWWQFVGDVVNKFPQPNNVARSHMSNDNSRLSPGRPYARVPVEALEKKWDKVFQRKNLADVFDRVRMSPPSSAEADWTRLFDVYFPNSPPAEGKTNQNWSSFKYLNNYFRLRTLLGPQAWNALRAALRRQCNRRLAWLPKASPERVWWTAVKKTGNTLYHGDNALERNPCPIVVPNSDAFDVSFAPDEIVGPLSW